MMLFVSFMKAKPDSSVEERTARRLEWQYPEGMRVIGEYWLAGKEPDVIIVSECDDALTVMNAIFQWADLFDTTVIPAITSEAGLELAREIRASGAA
jgi:hypothetical protein